MVLQCHVNAMTQGVDSKTSHVHTLREWQRDDNGSMKDVLSVGVFGGAAMRPQKSVWLFIGCARCTQSNQLMWCP